MAKGNPFLGQVRGSIGDVTFYRANGQQISRSRNRKPYNPNSYGQLVQRAVSATVSRAYSAGKAIFDHSFEGRRVPGACANRFRKVNNDLLRATLMPELQGNVSAADGYATVVARSSTSPVPFGYRISEGSLRQTLFSIGIDDDDNDLLRASVSTPLSNEKVDEWCTRNGVSAGDIYTVVAFGIRDDSWEPNSDPETYNRQFNCYFGFVRLTVLVEALTSETLMSAAKWSDIFEVETTNYYFVKSDLVVDGISTSDVVYQAQTGSMGVIRSEENMGLRSTSDMVVPSAPSPQWGVKAAYLLETWDPALKSSAIDSPLILEGGSF